MKKKLEGEGVVVVECHFAPLSIMSDAEKSSSPRRSPRRSLSPPPAGDAPAAAPAAAPPAAAGGDYGAPPPAHQQQQQHGGYPPRSPPRSRSPPRRRREPPVGGHPPSVRLFLGGTLRDTHERDVRDALEYVLLPVASSASLLGFRPRTRRRRLRNRPFCSSLMSAFH